MKIKAYIGIGLIVILCVLALYSGISLSGVQGSMHDLSYATGGSQFTFVSGDPESQICVFCHTPHKAVTGIRFTSVLNSTGFANAGAPSTSAFLLWNRSLPNLQGTPKFTLYQSSTLNYANSNEIRVYSLLCLSCHDGVSALNVLANPPAGSANPLDNPSDPAATYIGFVYNGDPGFGWGANIGDRVNVTQTMNLSNDHPISFDYPSVLVTADTGLSTVGVATGLGYVNSPAVRLFPNPRDSSLRNSMECSTCHDVHNEGTGDMHPFLVMTKENSALCRNCHLK